MDVEAGENSRVHNNAVLFKDINYLLPLCFGGHCRTLVRKHRWMQKHISPGRPPTEILTGVSGAFLPGRLTCVLGPSGAGKTTLLHLLSGRKKFVGKGELMFTGGFVVLVSQDICLMGNLTARETLNFAAALKLSKSTRASQAERIQAVATKLGIAHTLDTRANKMSGGERKRLSIALELITNPPILLLDEPTSGLDSVSSVDVMLALQAVARDGCVVACTLHQPASRLFALCDDVLLLAKGRTLYVGPRHELLGALENADLICPQYYNPADYLLEVAHGAHMGNLNALEDLSEKYVQELLDEWKHVQSFALVEDLPSTNKEKSEIHAEDSKHLLNYSYAVKSRPQPARWDRQLLALLFRAFTCGTRDTQLAPVRTAAHVVVAILLGVLFAGCGSDANRVYTNASCLFFFLLFIFFANSMPTIQTFPSEASVVLQEHLNHWYSLLAYFFSKVIAELPLQILCPTLFVFPAWYMTDQPFEFFRVGLMWLLCFLMTVIAQTFGLLTGAAFSIEMALFVVPAANIPMLMFSGFFIPLGEIPEYLRPISSISYFQYAFNGAMQAAYGFDRPPLVCHEGYCPFMKPTAILDKLGLVQDFYTNIWALIIWLILLQVSLFLVLLGRVKLSCR